MDAAVFKAAIDEIAESKGISHDAVVVALSEALQRAYIKYLGGGDDAVVEATIDEANGRITLAQIKNVKKDVEDDYLEISAADAKEDADEMIENLEDDLKEAKEADKKADKPVAEKAKDAAVATKDAVKGAAVATKDAVKETAKDVKTAVTDKKDTKAKVEVKADAKADAAKPAASAAKK